VCRRVVDATHQIAEEWPGDIRLEFRQHALKMHKNAYNAAMASLAAHQQGKFWAYHDLLFQNQGTLDVLSLESYAQQLGLNISRFKTDMASAQLAKRVTNEGDFARALGASGTPAFLINGRIQVGWGSWNGFRSLVQRELNQVNELLAAGKKSVEIHTLRAKENSKDIAAFQAYKKYVLKSL
jgi:protein-disulfide isomerase